MIRSAFLLPLLLLPGFASSVWGQEGYRFTGIESCATSGCHGGGEGNNQVQKHRKDQHFNADVAMGQATWSVQLTQNLGITSAFTSSRCTICHAPVSSMPANHFVPDTSPTKAGRGVSCESCHGPAEFWLRSHTRTDYNHDMRLKLGMRDTKSLYGRANVCVGCHQNLDPEIVANGHVPLTFELDDYDTRETAHWKDEGAWLGPKRWVTGQAVALREVSFMLSNTRPNPKATAGIEDLQGRFDAIAWVLNKTDVGRGIPLGGDYGSVQSAADKVARSASQQSWTKESTKALFAALARTGPDFSKSREKPAIAAKRAYFLAIGLRRLYLALRADGGLAASANIETTLDNLFKAAQNESAFDNEGFARLLEQIEVELAKG